MGHIIPKLNLNRNPELVDNYGLVCAKNIRLLDDGTIGPDTAEVSIEIQGKLNALLNEDYDINNEDETSEEYKIVGVIPYNTCFYLFVVNGNDSYIVKYDEKTNDVEECNCNWHSHYTANNPTKINGICTINLKSHIILSFGEYYENDSDDNDLIPFKVIDLNISSTDDDESIYTQSPTIPITNFVIKKTYHAKVSPGVYQFFIRYKINEGLYTNWFLASKPIYLYTKKKQNTVQGSVYYVDTTKDSYNGLVFNVEHLYPEYLKYYKSFQIGFIQSTYENGTVARSWKEYPTSETVIFFDRSQEYIEEIDIQDLLEVTYDINNVKNVTSFKNKTYISNYIENSIVGNLETNQHYANTCIDIKLTTSLGQDVAEDTDVEYILMNGSSTIYEKFVKSTMVSPENINGYAKNLIKGAVRDNDWEEHQEVSNQIGVMKKQSFTSVEYKIDNSYNRKYDEVNKLADDLNYIILSNDLGQVPGYEGINNIAYYLKNRMMEETPDEKHENILMVFTNGGWFVINRHTEDMVSEGSTDYWAGYDDLYDFSSLWDIKIYPEECELRLDNGGNVYYISTDGHLIITNVDDIQDTRYNKIYAILEVVYTSEELPSDRHGESDYNPATDGIFYYSFDLNVYTFNIHNVKGVITQNYVDTTTLIPYQVYNFYVHFVTNDGKETVGYKIGDSRIVTTNDNYIPVIGNLNISPIKLVFNASYLANCANNISLLPSFEFKQPIPKGYSACFITIARVAGNIKQLFEEDLYKKRRLYNCLEADMYLDTVDSVDKILYMTNTGLFTNIANAEVEYIPSAYSNDGKLFGTTGKVSAKEFNEATTEGTGYFIDTGYQANENNLTLERCSLYIKVPEYTTSIRVYRYNQKNHLNCLGFNCEVVKPTTNEYDYYRVDTDIYAKNATETGVMFERIDPITDYPALLKNTPTSKQYVRSNYNLNCISKYDTAGINRKITTDSTNDNSYIYDVINSPALDQIYDLKSCFRDYTKPLYYPYNETTNYITEYNNTVRSSEAYADEADTIQIKFNASDYYNAPTNKGKIIFMKSIGNSIIIHTEDSMFMFNGNNTISANGGEQIQLQESNVFDTGIVEIFGSEYGFGGIQKQHHQIISENGYLFYDSDANVIYLYQDNKQNKVISDTIKKLLKNVLDVRFASDYYNNRFFIKLEYETNNIILSYDVRSKSFISLHDINFDYAFNSKTLCYLVKNDNIYKKEVVYSPTNILVQPLYDNVDIFPIYTNANKTLAKPYIDIICNNDYDNVKVLDYVSWICKKVNNPYRGIQTNEFVETDDNSQLEKMNVAEEDEIDYPAQGILIYSNLTAKGTTYFKFNTVAELNAILKDNRRLYAEQGLYDATQGEYGSLKPRDMPYFQLGHWNYNYFRNDLDNTDVTKTWYPQTHSDNKSLLYGNYFVVRLIFDVGVNFKLKDLMFAINNSYETRR